MRYIFAGSHQQYVDWSDGQKLPHEYIVNANQIAGKRIAKSQIVYFGGYRDRSDYNEVYDALQRCIERYDSEWERVRSKMEENGYPLRSSSAHQLYNANET